MVHVSVDTGKAIGSIRPLQGVNNGPLSFFDGNSFAYDASVLFRQAGISRVRLHDTEYPFGGECFVDIPCVFPNFNADADDPANYWFKDTDTFLKAIDNAGCKILYRLGVTIEHQRQKRFIYPPADFKKWADICAHIIDHYTNGWADGFYYKGILWEIWNEPNGTTSMWLGTKEQYYEFYAVASKLLKERFPKEVIGGPAITGANAFEFLDPFADFLAADPSIPMDFFSWHLYNKTPSVIYKRSAEAKAFLERAKRQDALSILDEYNYVEDWVDLHKNDYAIGGQKGAAFVAGILTGMQETGVAEGSYYSAQVWMSLGSNDRVRPRVWRHNPPTGTDIVFNGMYRAVNDHDIEPLPVFDTFVKFKKLYELGSQLACDYVREEDFFCLAARNTENAFAMLTNYSNESLDVKINGDTLKLSPYEVTLHELSI